jgi:hypothetical protein
MPNISKLVRWNLSQPFDKRVGFLDVIDRVAFYKERGHVVSLYTQIRSEIDNQTKELSVTDL